MIQDTFKLSINSWISACDCEKAFRILDRLSHDEAIKVLVNVAEKIIDSAKGKKLKDVEYLGALIFGKKSVVEKLTDKFKLLK